jgi:Fe-S-cluster-containing dehydrogenase component/formate-dependent nitrite reductase membrane component NrfD
VQYGFVINHDTCIGCHACTTACKQENSVPVGSFRTAVKYVEVGKFPFVRRHFLVQRCNHCTNAPCVTICPVNALSKRPDGIVDIDRDACIGCRACMQACPYDALYLNDDLGAVEKCHFCAHRIDQGLSPACVNVCPVGAIVPGDLHDPNSPASRLKAANETKARRVEQKTGPNVHYVGAHELALEPGMVERPDIYLWSQRPPTKPEAWPESLPLAKDARVVLDAGHKVEWGWPVALYLVTKGVAAGVAMVTPLMPFLGELRETSAMQLPSPSEAGGGGIGIWPEIVTLFFTLLTLFLLTEDLKKPFHFYKLFTRPNWNSWLVKGGILLTAFLVVTGTILSLGVLEALGYVAASISIGSLEIDLLDRLLPGLRWLNLPLGIAAAGYTAFLFAQCKGRDLWEHRLLLPSLIAQAAFCGLLAATLFFESVPGEPLRYLPFVFLLVFAQGAFWWLHHRIVHGPQETNNALQAAAFARQVKVMGVKADLMALRMMVVGSFLAVSSLLFGFGIVPALVGAPLALAGVYLLEHVYVRAAQLPPLS